MQVESLLGLETPTPERRHSCQIFDFLAVNIRPNLHPSEIDEPGLQCSRSAEGRLHATHLRFPFPGKEVSHMAGWHRRLVRVAVIANLIGQLGLEYPRLLWRISCQRRVCKESMVSAVLPKDMEKPQNCRDHRRAMRQHPSGVAFGPPNDTY